MEYRLTINGRLIGLNELIDANRRNRYEGAKQKKESMDLVKWSIRNQLRGVQIKKPVALHFTWVEKNRMRDYDNICGAGMKIILDSLVSCGVLRGDSQRYVVGLSNNFLVDKYNPHIEVVIEVMNDER